MTREEAIKRLKEIDIRDALQEDYDALYMAIEALEQKPKTIQEIQAESEKYQKAFEDGYEQGYAQARFDYEQEPCEDVISRQAVDELSKELVHTTRDKADFLCNFWEGLQKLPPVKPQITTDTITEYCKEHNYILCEKGIERKILDDIKTEIKQLPMYATRFEDCVAIHINKNDVLGIIEKHIRKEKDND